MEYNKGSNQSILIEIQNDSMLSESSGKSDLAWLVIIAVTLALSLTLFGQAADYL